MDLSNLHRLALRVLFFSVFCLLSAPSVAASRSAESVPSLDNYFKETFNTSDGLPHNTINAIAQSPDGYLWFATWEGVARFNGREFRVFDRSPETGLPDAGISTLHLDHQQTLWVAGARGGLAQVKAGQWHAFEPLGVLINAVLLDKQNRLWIATEGRGLVRQDTDGQRTFYTQSEGMPSEQVYSLLEGAGGQIWVGTAEGLVFLDEQLQVQPMAANEYNGVPVFALALTQQAELLVGTEQGLYQSSRSPGSPITLLENIPIRVILPQNEQVVWVGTIDRGLIRLNNGVSEQIDSNLGLPNNRVISLYLDDEQNLWVGTNGGIYRLRDAPFTTYTRTQGLSGDFTRTVLSHSDGCMYIGSSRGLNRFCDGSITQIDLSAVSVGQSVLSLAEGPNQRLWVGTYADGLIELYQGKVLRHFHTGNSLPGNEVRAILPLPNNQVWVGTAHGLSLLSDTHITTINSADGLYSHFIIDLYYRAEKQQLFIGTGSGVYILENEQITSLDLFPFDDAQYAFGFTEDKAANLLWITTDRGLLAYDFNSGKITLLGRQQGMPIDKLFQMVIDQQGYLWISSNRGILRLNRAQALAVIAGKQAEISYELFGEADGLKSMQANGGSSKAATLHQDGSVWFATSIGVSRVQPERLAKFSKIIPPVVIEKLQADGQNLPLHEPVILSAGTNRIEFSYAGLGYVMSQHIQYRTQLEGFDRDWVHRGSLSSAEYTNLPPGNYRFLVSASYPNGEWSIQEASFRLTLLPHLWQRWWFQLAMVVLLLLVVLMALRWRVASLKRSEVLLRKLVSEQTKELQLLARQDALTGLANRRAFDEELQHEYLRAQRANKPLCLAMLDIDHFKQINDRLSHAVGDEVLKRIAALLKQQCRTIDKLARWGGEEFVILLPDTTLHDANEVCERLRQKVEKLDLTDLAPNLHLTISIGLTINTKLELAQLLVSADKALYKAKRNGRNKVVLADNAS